MHIKYDTTYYIGQWAMGHLHSTHPLKTRAKTVQQTACLAYHMYGRCGVQQQRATKPQPPPVYYYCKLHCSLTRLLFRLFAVSVFIGIGVIVLCVSVAGWLGIRTQYYRVQMLITCTGK